MATSVASLAVPYFADWAAVDLRDPDRLRRLAVAHQDPAKIRLADELMPELVDRLLGGAVWSLQPPDPETRLEILRKKATGASALIPDSVLKTLASSLRGNVRELEGAVNSVKHYAKVTGKPVDQAGVREALGQLADVAQESRVRAARIRHQLDHQMRLVGDLPQAQHALAGQPRVTAIGRALADLAKTGHAMRCGQPRHRDDRARRVAAIHGAAAGHLAGCRQTHAARRQLRRTFRNTR